jgi:hypothetical protein
MQARLARFAVLGLLVALAWAVCGCHARDAAPADATSPRAYEHEVPGLTVLLRGPSEQRSLLEAARRVLERDGVLVLDRTEVARSREADVVVISMAAEPTMDAATGASHVLLTLVARAGGETLGPIAVEYAPKGLEPDVGSIADVLYVFRRRARRWADACRAREGGRVLAKQELGGATAN